jgi:uncharacterized protein (TIGR00297 family)
MTTPPVVTWITALLFGATAGLLAYRFRLLSRSGATAATFLGAVIYGSGSWPWTLPLLGFFLPSSLLSIWSKQRRPVPSGFYEKGSRRDAWQVLANGGPAGIFAVAWLATGDDQFRLAYLGSLAAASADTWGTELGAFSPTHPRLLSSFRSVDAGTSGGITFLGLAGSALGAALIATAGLWCMPGSLAVGVAAIMIAGVGGSLVDSLAGATIQAQYRCELCGRVTERQWHCGSKRGRVRGFSMVTNDLVNALCTLSGAGLALSAAKFLGASGS